jgi:hypothetical protein
MQSGILVLASVIPVIVVGILTEKLYQFILVRISVSRHDVSVEIDVIG